MGKWPPCASLGQEGTDGKDFNALPECLFLWVGEWVLNGFGERRGGHEGPVEAGNRHLNKGAEVKGRAPGACPPGASRPAGGVTAAGAVLGGSVGSQEDGLARGLWVRPEKRRRSGRCQEGRQVSGGERQAAMSHLSRPASHCHQPVWPGSCSRNIKISPRFISSPSRSFEIPAIRGRKLL